MRDRRTVLSGGWELLIGNGERYRIESEAGRGGSCVVYNAGYRDNLGYEHKVRIKEFYPCGLDLERGEDGSILVPAHEREEYAEAKARFAEAYRKNAEIKCRLGLINSTVNATNIHEAGGTLYTVMDYDEGRDYSASLDENLQSVFIRLKAVANVIKKYHAGGYLYLDIKPENIIIIPETKEHVLLCDFDSMFTRDEVRGGKVRISYSDGFAAPEQVMGRTEDICEATDIYAIGALLYFKIFGRKPGTLDCSIGTKYDFSGMVFQDSRFRPELFALLDRFLHKTLSASRRPRWGTVEEVIAALDGLIEASDVDSIYLVDNFSCHSTCFVGRRKEMDEILSKLNQSQVVFLSGMGGIGKTETAKYFAFENREKFRRVVFLPFADSIVETVCGNDLKLNHFQRGEGEQDARYFSRKLDALKEAVTERDLIILDNFDVETDENLEELFGCPGKFLVTTREDFSDYNYAQVEIDQMEDLRELLDLFFAYYSKECTDKEIKTIEKIIEWAQRHTMTVELIAKYLRTAEETAQELLEKLCQREGITGTEEIVVRHRKDKKLRAESIDGHLLALFDLSSFSQGECELIRSLSLLGYVRIRRDTFLGLLGGEDSARKDGEDGVQRGAERGMADEAGDSTEKAGEELDRLIRQGWVEYDERTGKVSLHQIILDLVYCHLKPVSENCPRIVRGMTAYAEKEVDNRAQRRVRRKLFNLFVRRLDGGDMNYARFLMAYCSWIRYRIEYLERAWEICERGGGEEAKRWFAQICIIQLRGEGRGEERFEEGLNLDEYGEKKVLEIVRLAENAYHYARNYSVEEAYLGRFCVNLAFDLDRAAANIASCIGADSGDNVKEIFNYAEYLLQEAESYLLSAPMPVMEKEALFERIKSFYLEDEVEDMDIIHRYFEFSGIMLERAVHISEGKYNAEVLEEENETDLDMVMELCMENGYMTWPRCECCQDDEKVSHYQKIIDGLRKEQDSIVAGGAARTDMVSDQGQEFSEPDILTEAVTLYGRYMEEKNPVQKEAIWKECAEYCRKLEQCDEISEDVAELLETYADRIENREKRIQFAIDVGDRYAIQSDSRSASIFYSYAVRQCEGLPEYSEQYLTALISCGEEMRWVDADKAVEYCRKAMEICELAKEPDEYLLSRIYRALGESFSGSDFYNYDQIVAEKKKCNYYLIAEHECEGKSREVQIKLWEDAASQYSYIKKYEDAEKCYQMLFSIWDSATDWKACGDFDSYWLAAVSRMEGLIEQEEAQKVPVLAVQLYKKMFTYLREEWEDDGLESKEEIIYKNAMELAGVLGKAGYAEKAVVLYMAAVVAATALDNDEETFNEMQSCMNGGCRRLFEVFCQALHGEIAGKTVDRVVEVWKRVQLLERANERFVEVEKELKWFVDRYQYFEIEFKR